MRKIDRNRDFNALRNEFSFFVYENFNFNFDDDALKITYQFNLSDKYWFRPTLTIPISGFRQNLMVSQEAIANMVFHIGMVELISYWKAACPPIVIIKPALLTNDALVWWKKLWFNGLGEFFYLNGIETNEDDFLSVKCQSAQTVLPFSFVGSEKVMIPVGGGKDSAVTLELIKNAAFRVAPFMLNPHTAGWNTLKSSGIPKEKAICAHRTIDPLLLDLNTKGFLNGHTPFSALLAFVTLLAGALNGIKHVALSNESSANEATIPGTLINHQYSKSWQFEGDFRGYVSEFICTGFNYFSFLRPLNELQIAAIFVRYPNHFSTFRSCNAGSKTNEWCGKCPKCLFTSVILSPFMESKKLTAIFEKNLLDDLTLKPIFDELTGVAAAKPFECVGTIDEVNAAVVAVIKKYKRNFLPALLESYRNQSAIGRDLTFFLADFNNHHFLNNDFLEILKKALHD